MPLRQRCDLSGREDPGDNSVARRGAEPEQLAGDRFRCKNQLTLRTLRRHLDPRDAGADASALSPYVQMACECAVVAGN